MDTLGTPPEMSNFDCLAGRAGATPMYQGHGGPDSTQSLHYSNSCDGMSTDVLTRYGSMQSQIVTGSRDSVPIKDPGHRNSEPSAVAGSRSRASALCQA